MKKLKSFIILAVLTPLIHFSQNTVEEVKPQDLIQEFGLETIAPNFEINPVQIDGIANRTNTIYIEQIGANNNIQVKTATESSVLDIVQNGNNNALRLNFSAMTATETILQRGNNHYLAAFGKAPSLNLERTIEQNGNGQSLTIHGSNSISEKMQLNMKGSASTIIIRNFN